MFFGQSSQSRRNRTRAHVDQAAPLLPQPRKLEDIPQEAIKQYLALMWSAVKMLHDAPEPPPVLPIDEVLDVLDAPFRAQQSMMAEMTINAVDNSSKIYPKFILDAFTWVLKHIFESQILEMDKIMHPSEERSNQPSYR